MTIQTLFQNLTSIQSEFTCEDYTTPEECARQICEDYFSATESAKHCQDVVDDIQDDVEGCVTDLLVGMVAIEHADSFNHCLIVIWGLVYTYPMPG